ncbi:MAG: glutamine amidotransferase [Hyphomicrobiales bacterium]
MPRKVLIILHQETSSPGRVGLWLEKHGYSLDIRRPRFGDRLPPTLAEHAGAVMFGGPMSANDREPYVRRETDWLKIPLAEEKPFLGICLGAQMLVRHLGGHVAPREDCCVEIGYYPIRPTAAGSALMEWPEKVYQWHREGFSLPKGSTLLAEGELFPHQAFRYGPSAYGIQFHPELTLAMLYRWTVRGAPRMKQPCAQARGAHFDGRAVYDPATVRWLDRFLGHWIGQTPGV